MATDTEGEASRQRRPRRNKTGVAPTRATIAVSVSVKSKIYAEPFRSLDAAKRRPGGSESGGVFSAVNEQLVR
ncbi:MAG: hypothetical protein NVS3B21_23620 [Acidimicrobiales bacterium]